MDQTPVPSNQDQVAKFRDQFAKLQDQKPNCGCGIEHTQVQYQIAKLHDQIAGLQTPYDDFAIKHIVEGQIVELKNQLSEILDNVADDVDRKIDEVERRLKSEKIKQATAKINRHVETISTIVVDLVHPFLLPLTYTFMVAFFNWAFRAEIAAVFAFVAAVYWIAQFSLKPWQNSLLPK